MKQFIIWLGKRMTNALVTALFFMLAIGGIAYALTSFPSTAPDGISNAGGKFATLFNNILASGNYVNDTTGKVKLATFADNSQTTNQIGALAAGKWCKTVGGKVDCTSDAPSSTPTPPIGTALYGGIAWQTTDTGPITHQVAIVYCNNLAPYGAWRLPTAGEMSSALVLGMTLTLAAKYWSDTPTGGDFYLAKHYDYLYSMLGSQSTLPDGSPFYVRCVKNL